MSFFPWLGFRFFSPGKSKPSIPKPTSGSNRCFVHPAHSHHRHPGRNHADLALRFNIPTIANGHVYIDAKHEVDVYGLIPAGR